MTQYDLLRLVFREHSGALSPTQKTVLLHLIDRTNKHGQCWPSQPLLSKQTGFSPKTIQRAVQELTKAGFISVVFSGKGRAHSNIYQLDVNAIGKLTVKSSSSDEENRSESPLLGEENRSESPPLRSLCPPLRSLCPLKGVTESYKEIQEDIQEEIHEEGSAQQKAKEIDPDNTGHTSEDQQRFMLPSDWKPNNHLLMEEARQRSLEGLFNLDQNYRRKMLNSFKEKYTGKKGVCKTEEEWHQVFCKSIEVQLRIDGVAL